MDSPRSPSPTTDDRRSQRFAAIAWVIVGVLYAEFIRHAMKYAYTPQPTKGDFLAFYEAAREMVHSGDLYAERHRNYIYPPLVAFLYLPLTLLDDPPTMHRAAGIVSLFASAAMSIGALWIFARESVRRLAPKAIPIVVPVVMLMALVVVGDKIRGELRMWQTNALMLFLIALGLRWLDKRPVLAGMAIGLAVNVKYLPIFFLPYLLARRRFAAAGGMVLGMLTGAFAPALWVGWSKNLEYLRIGFGGLLALVGVNPGEGQRAVTEDIAGGLSISLTSVFARALGGANHATGALAISAAIAGVVCVLIALAYRRARLPLIVWPDARGQSTGPFPALVMLEWSVLLLGLLIFSPQTNTRHLYMLLAPAAAAAAIIVAPSKPTLRVPVIVAAVLLLLALILPPGGMENGAAVRWWHGVGGPSYGMLVLMGVLAWAGVQTAASNAGASTNNRG